MKRFFSTLFLMLSVCLFSTAQVHRNNSVFVRANYTTNVYTSVSGEFGHNFTPGVTADFGAKQFFNKDNGWFVEESAKFLFSDLPFINSVHGLNREKAVIPYDRLRELGAGIQAKVGYDFILNNKLSLAVGCGPDARYIFKYSPDCVVGKECNDHNLHSLNLRLSAGVDLNINKTTISLSFSPDIINRGRADKKYSTLQIGLGIGYYF